MLILVGRNQSPENKLFDAVDTFLDVYRQGIRKDINDLTATEYFDIADSIHKNTVAYWEAILADPDADPELRAIAPANIISTRKLVEDLDKYYVSKIDNDRLIAEANFEDYENYMRWLKDAKDAGETLKSFDDWVATGEPSPGETEETVKEDALENGKIVATLYRELQAVPEEQVQELRATTTDSWARLALFTNDTEVARVANENAAATKAGIDILERYNNAGNDNDRVAAELFLDKYATYVNFYEWVEGLNVGNLKSYTEWVALGAPSANYFDDMIIQINIDDAGIAATTWIPTIDVQYAKWVHIPAISAVNIQVVTPSGVTHNLTQATPIGATETPQYRNGGYRMSMTTPITEIGLWEFKHSSISTNAIKDLWGNQQLELDIGLIVTREL